MQKVYTYVTSIVFLDIIILGWIIVNIMMILHNTIFSLWWHPMCCCCTTFPTTVTAVATVLLMLVKGQNNQSNLWACKWSRKKKKWPFAHLWYYVTVAWANDEILAHTDIHTLLMLSKKIVPPMMMIEVLYVGLFVLEKQTLPYVRKLLFARIIGGVPSSVTNLSRPISTVMYSCGTVRAVRCCMRGFSNFSLCVFEARVVN